MIYYKNSDFDNAILNFKKSAELQQDNANSHYDLAVAYVDRFREKESKGSLVSEDLNDLRGAISHYTKAAELNHGLEHASSNAKIVQEVLNDYEKKGH